MGAAPSPLPRPESRLPVALTLLLLLLLIEGLHDRFRVWPDWVPLVAIAVLWGAMAGVTFAADTRRWLRLESLAVRSFAVVLLASQALSLTVLIDRILGTGQASSDGIQLLTSSAVIWACNMIAFSLIYWQLDGGGPLARLEGEGRQHPDWLFVEEANPDSVPPGWRPGFIDYLFLGFSTATAFSTTDIQPLTRRAKLLMMAESLISLATLAVVASRAINVLGS